MWIRGKSGSGKSTFLQLLSGIIPAQKGLISLGDFIVTKENDQNIQRFRLQNIGFVHQENHLIEHWTVKQNFQLIESDSSDYQDVLAAVHLPTKTLNQLVSKLSGGERQRALLARLFLQRPRLVLLDEPTSHLDDWNADHILKNIETRFKGTTMLIVSHDNRLAKYPFKSIEFSEINK